MTEREQAQGRDERQRAISEIDGTGAGAAMAGVVACLVMGALLPPLRTSVGLTNVAIAHLMVVILVALVGGRAAAMLTALYAALNYNFFFTSPVHTLAIDSVEQVITVVLLFVAGLAASLVGRASRRQAAAARDEAAAIGLLNQVALAAAGGGDPDRAAAEGLRRLLDARLVQVWRAGPGGDRLTAHAGTARGEAVELAALPRLDPEGRIPGGHRRVVGGTLVLPAGGVAVELTRQGRRVGTLVLVPEPDLPVERATRTAVAATAHVLAAASPPPA